MGLGTLSCKAYFIAYLGPHTFSPSSNIKSLGPFEEPFLEVDFPIWALKVGQETHMESTREAAQARVANRTNATNSSCMSRVAKRAVVGVIRADAV